MFFWQETFAEEKWSVNFPCGQMLKDVYLIKGKVDGNKLQKPYIDPNGITWKLAKGSSTTGHEPKLSETWAGCSTTHAICKYYMRSASTELLLYGYFSGRNNVKYLERCVNDKGNGIATFINDNSTIQTTETTPMKSTDANVITINTRLADVQMKVPSSATIKKAYVAEESQKEFNATVTRYNYNRPDVAPGEQRNLTKAKIKLSLDKDKHSGVGYIKYLIRAVDAKGKDKSICSVSFLHTIKKYDGDVILIPTMKAYDFYPRFTSDRDNKIQCSVKCVSGMCSAIESPNSDTVYESRYIIEVKN